ncbi:Protein kinase domain-containing protein [Mycena sanguinolenta]|uniref:Protein kinase domain-containing protein n=1 Tax=Mycena sanguinolenta TaxID=230812 RepID=A0A8H6YAS1_9AGAR|nr:Protein kinase domain-containing protein [Mycena sanguinolenta]
MLSSTSASTFVTADVVPASEAGIPCGPADTLAQQQQEAPLVFQLQPAKPPHTNGLDAATRPVGAVCAGNDGELGTPHPAAPIIKTIVVQMGGDIDEAVESEDPGTPLTGLMERQSDETVITVDPAPSLNDKVLEGLSGAMAIVAGAWKRKEMVKETVPEDDRMAEDNVSLGEEDAESQRSDNASGNGLSPNGVLQVHPHPSDLLNDIHQGPWLEIHRNLVSYVTRTLELYDGALFSKALLRLSGECGLHPTCFTLTGVKKMGQQVAGGGFGDIWKGSVGGQTVAVKSMRQFKDDDVKVSMKKLGREALIWRQLSHPNLLPFFGLYMLDNRLCLISPWMDNGDLKDFLKNAPADIDRISLMVDVARGLEYLHSQDVVHGDLKPVNILITPSGRACISDFGLSAIVDALSLKMSFSSRSGRAGTVRYQAPELLKNQSSTHFGSDIYAFACVGYEILTGKVPFYEVDNEAAVICKVVIDEARPLGLGMVFPDDLRLLVEDCWQQKAEKRPTSTTILGRLLRQSLGDEIKRSHRPDWEFTYSARFRRSIQAWPLFPSIAEVEQRIPRVSTSSPSASSPSPPASSSRQPPEPIPAPPDEDMEMLEADKEAQQKKEAEVAKEAGNEAYMKGELEKAASQFEKAWNLWPQDITCLTDLGAVYYELGDYDEAIEVCEKAIEEGRSLGADHKLIAKAYGHIGTSFREKGDYASAIKYFEESLTEHHTHDILNKLWEAAYLKADTGKQASKKIASHGKRKVQFKPGNRFARAVKTNRESTMRVPSDAREYNSRATAYMKLGAFPEALKHVNAAIQADPEFSKPRCLFAGALLIAVDT